MLKCLERLQTTGHSRWWMGTRTTSSLALRICLWMVQGLHNSSLDQATTLLKVVCLGPTVRAATSCRHGLRPTTRTSSAAKAAPSLGECPTAAASTYNRSPSASAQMASLSSACQCLLSEHAERCAAHHVRPALPVPVVGHACNTPHRIVYLSIGLGLLAAWTMAVRGLDTRIQQGWHTSSPLPTRQHQRVLATIAPAQHLVRAHRCRGNSRRTRMEISGPVATLTPAWHHHSSSSPCHRASLTPLTSRVTCSHRARVARAGIHQEDHLSSTAP